MTAVTRRREEPLSIPHQGPDSGDCRAAPVGNREAVGPIVIAAGGTAGHVFPAAAVAHVLLSRRFRPVVFTDIRAARQDFAGAEVHVLAGAGIAGRGPLRGLAALCAIASGTIEARRRMAGLHPAAVIGFGGYASLAPVLAARLFRRRPAILLHEQNAVLGRANRGLARLADAVAISFAQTRHAPAGAVLTGNPVRPAVALLAARCYAARIAEGSARLLVLGGSLGARVFSDLVPAALAEGRDRTRLDVVQQCRPEDVRRVEAAYAAAGIRAEVAAFFADMPDRMAGCDLVIARAGASTVAELAVIGRPAILVPLPGAIDDHQRANAEALAQAGAAVVVDEAGLSAARLGAQIFALLGDAGRRDAMARAASGFGRADAAASLTDLITDLAARRGAA